MENEKSSNAWSIVAAVAIILAIILAGGIYYFYFHKDGSKIAEPAAKNTTEPVALAPIVVPTLTEENATEPLSYSIDGKGISVSKEIEPFGYTVEQLKSMAAVCGTNHAAGYFENLVAMFSGAQKIIYNFRYTDSSLGTDRFLVTLLPNKPGYTTLDQFKKDFNICVDGGTAYPSMLNSNWLMFVNSCGNGIADGKGEASSCEELQNIVGPTLKLN